MNNIQITYHTLLRRLHSVRIKEKLFSLFQGILNFITACLMILAISLSFISLIHLNVRERITFDSILLIFILIALIKFLFYPLFQLIVKKDSPSYNLIAQRVGNKFPSIKDRLINAIQLYDFYKQNKEGYSLELVDRALTDIDSVSKDRNFISILDTTSIKKAARLLVGSIAVFVLISTLFSTKFYNSANQLLHPFTSFEKVIEFKLTLSPGNIEIIKDEAVQIKIIGEGKIPEQIILHLNNSFNGHETEYILHQKQENYFEYTIESIKDSTEYYVSTDEYISEKYLISVIELPMVRNLQLKINYPDYSRIESRFLDENVGDITALKGSVANININANKKLKEAKVILKNQKERDLNVLGNSANGKIKILTDDEYYIALKDQSDHNNMDPIEYRINIIEDAYPAVKITVPGKDVDITEEMLLMLSIEAEDDFGFSLLQLAYRIFKPQFNLDTTYHYIPLKLDNYQTQKIRLNHNWDLTNLNLLPEDVVTYYVEAFDNDNVSGPKSAKSLTYSIRFPSINEIFTDVQQEHEQAYETFEDMYEQSKELKEKLSELVQEMKKDPNLNWEEKQQLEDVVKTQQQMQQALEEVEQKLDEMIEQMEKNDLTSVETLKKYFELQQLMQEIVTEDLKEAIKDLNKAMESINPEELKKAVEKLDINQEEFLKSIEKTLSILKRLQIEQRLDEVTKKAEQLLKEQTELLEKADQASKEDKNKLAKEQKDIQKDTEELKKQIEDLKEKMSEFSEMPTSQIESSIDMMNRERLTENMNQASQNFQSGNMSKGQQQGQMAQNSLSELSDMLKNAKQQLMQSQKQQVMNELKRISNDLMRLSMAQENVIKSGKGLSRNSPQLENMADRQQDLISGLERVAERANALSNKTFFMTPQISRAINQSLSQMQQSIQKIEARNNSQASRKQGQAMASLNEGIKQVQQSMKQLSSSQSASGLQEMLDQLAQMSAKQQGLNQQTMQLGMGQKLTMAQQAAMARMAAEQAALKKSMEQLQKEFGNRSEILGRLDNIAREMDDVVKDLNSKNVSRKTINKQRKILSRLLDAQKSIQRREYSRKRKAETGKNYTAKNPGQLPVDLGEKDRELRQDLLKALKEGYTKDYQELIKKYFEALVNESENN